MRSGNPAAMKAQAWILLCALTGCGGAATSRSVSRADIAYPQRTRLTGYVVSGGIGGHEDTPGQVPRTAVLDKAVLESDGRRDCVVLTMRTALNRDDTLSQWTATLNGIQAYRSGSSAIANRCNRTTPRDQNRARKRSTGSRARPSTRGTRARHSLE